MKAVFKRELKACFSGMMSYLIIAGMLALAGFLMILFNVNGRYPTIESCIQYMLYSYLLVIPLLTCDAFAKEKRENTQRLLFSTRLSHFGIVIGKYLARLAILAAVCAVLSIYPLILGIFGATAYAANYAMILGFFLLGAALLALGLLVASLSGNRITAFFISLILLTIMLFMPYVRSFLLSAAYSNYAVAGLLALILILVWIFSHNITVALGAGLLFEAPVLIGRLMGNQTAVLAVYSQILRKLALFEEYAQFMNGTLNLPVLFFDVLYAALCVFLCTLKLKSDRLSARRALS